ncbi:MAG TPA: RsbRD N-terminal domain-containing protein [Dissulfurispiraceae bacterium]|nr:RsbRD N-terminal domain-containing protein [Dissulfurispiraceae bacterium]
MKLEDLLKKQRSAIIDKWFDRIIASYPDDTAEFLKKKSGFANPVGQTTFQGIQDIFDGLLLDAEPTEIEPFLDSIIRVRAVQDFSPSEALNFIFQLKKIIREEISPSLKEADTKSELDALESRIDSLALLSFDIFMKCREKLYDIKANELRDRTLWLLKKSNLLTETPDETEDRDSGERDKNINTNETKEVR